MTEAEQSKLQQALAAAIETEAPALAPRPTVRLQPNDGSLSDQIARLEGINRQAADRIRRRRMELMIDWDRRLADIEADFKRRVIAAEEHRDGENRHVTDEIRKQLEELATLETRLKPA